MSRYTRRTFVKTAAAAGAAFPLFTVSGTKASGQVVGANERIRVAVAGIRGRGGAHIDGFAGMKDVEVAYLVDPDSSLFDSRSKQVKSKGGNDPVCVQDIRKALEDKELNAVSIATTNHWHSLISIWACQAGKDVYVEKPMSHNVWEGRKVVEAARKYNRIVQHGTQQRSSGGRAREMAIIQSGKYGKLLVSKGYCCKPRWSIGFKDHEDPPSYLDFNVWLGPAPEQPFHRNLVHYNWHWFWDTGNGDIGNQGVHEMDVARWAIKGGTLPKRVWSVGGRFGYEDQGQTANTQLAVMDYGDTLLVFETRGLVGKHKEFPAKVTNEFYTTDGVIKGGKFYPNSGGSPESLSGDVDAPVTPGGPFGAFIACCRSRKVEEVNGEALDAHYSSALCHLANISYRLGKPARFSQPPKHFAHDNEIVQQGWEMIVANLKGVGVDLDAAEYVLGRPLELDVENEKFVGDPEANALLSRQYRKPFVVPQEV